MTIHHKEGVTGHSNTSTCKTIERNLGVFRRPARMMVSADWTAVTCRRCLKKRPAELPSEPVSCEPAPEPVSCLSCGGEARELGTLGKRTHYRCRNCGADFSRT